MNGYAWGGGVTEIENEGFGEIVASIVYNDLDVLVDVLARLEVGANGITSLDEGAEGGVRGAVSFARGVRGDVKFLGSERRGDKAEGCEENRPFHDGVGFAAVALFTCIRGIVFIGGNTSDVAVVAVEFQQRFESHVDGVFVEGPHHADVALLDAHGSLEEKQGEFVPNLGMRFRLVEIDEFLGIVLQVVELAQIVFIDGQFPIPFAKHGARAEAGRELGGSDGVSIDWFFPSGSSASCFADDGLLACDET